MNAAAIAEAKRSLRAQIRAYRRELDPGVLSAASASVVARLEALPEIEQAETIMLYGAAPDEIDPEGLADIARSRGARITYPRVEAHGLDVVEVTATTAFTTGFAGIREPLGPPIPTENVDVVVVPGLAFDRSGRRLGQGRAYYDRLLPTMRATRIAIGLDEQLVDAVPVDPHDVLMDAVVTPSVLVRCR